MPLPYNNVFTAADLQPQPIMSPPADKPRHNAISTVATIANTETVVISDLIPANTLKPGTTIEFLAYGLLTSDANAGSSVFRLRVGPTTLTGNIAATRTIANNINVAGNGPCRFEGSITIRTVGASGVALGSLFVLADLTVPFSAVIEAVEVTATAGAVAVDTTVANRVELTYISGLAAHSMKWEIARITTEIPAG